MCEIGRKFKKVNRKSKLDLLVKKYAVSKRKADPIT